MRSTWGMLPAHVEVAIFVVFASAASVKGRLKRDIFTVAISFDRFVRAQLNYQWWRCENITKDKTVTKKKCWCFQKFSTARCFLFRFNRVFIGECSVGSVENSTELVVYDNKSWISWYCKQKRLCTRPVKSFNLKIHFFIGLKRCF